MMHEHSFKLATPDGKQIFCILNQAGATPARRVVVLSHGLTGGPNEYMHQMARNHFLARGYDVVRFAYYWAEEGCRRLDETTLAIHAIDLNVVLDYARRKHEEIFVCGHSAGGLTMLFAQPKVTALSFWDSAYRPGMMKFSEAIDGKTYLMFGGKRTLVGAAMVAEAQRLLASPEELHGMAASIQSPAQIIVAEDGDRLEMQQELLAALTTEKELHIVRDADHNFYHRNTVEELLELTEAWFARHSSSLHSDKRARA